LRGIAGLDWRRRIIGRNQNIAGRASRIMRAYGRKNQGSRKSKTIHASIPVAKSANTLFNLKEGG
jgi:hypothetical protein